MKFQPVFFEKNRVGRVYTGGKLFHGFFGYEPVDSFLPEEWIASSVKALNRQTASEKEGVSKIKDSSIFFDELLEKYPLEMLGSIRKMRILVKILDSAVRLPAQAHPDKEFSREHFNCEYGKTESWIVLDTRPDAKIYFGFKDGADKEAFTAAIDESEADKNAMERLMECFEPKIGDVFLVPAKTVHAIGAGCLILEVQEPTDFTIQPERYCGEYRLSDEEMYLSLSKDEAIECFDFGKAAYPKLSPRIITKTDTAAVESLVGTENTDSFIINRIKLSGGEYSADVKNSYAVYIVTEGEGAVFGGDYFKKIKKGDYFFMPAFLMGKFKFSGNAEIIECY